MVWTGQRSERFVFIVCYKFPLRERTSGIPGFVDKPKDMIRALPQQQSVPQFGGGQRMGKCSALQWKLSSGYLHALYLDSGKISPIKQKRTSRQINTKRQKQKTDYENLLLLQKIQNVKPSNSVRNAFG